MNTTFPILTNIEDWNHLYFAFSNLSIIVGSVAKLCVISARQNGQHYRHLASSLKYAFAKFVRTQSQMKSEYWGFFLSNIVKSDVILCKFHSIQKIFSHLDWFYSNWKFSIPM